jgi:hypothetical protein
MPFAAVTNVSLEGQDQDLGVKLLNEMLVPRLKGLTGFRAARFVRSLDGKTGIGAVIFETEDNAKAGLDVMMDRPAEAPPVESTAIYEVVVEV